MDEEAGPDVGVPGQRSVQHREAPYSGENQVLQRLCAHRVGSDQQDARGGEGPLAVGPPQTELAVVLVRGGHEGAAGAASRLLLSVVYV